MRRIGIDIGSQTLKVAEVALGDGDEPTAHTYPLRDILGRPLHHLREALGDVLDGGNGDGVLVGMTGVGAPALGELLGLTPLDESICLTAAVEAFEPSLRTLVEMGRESQKFIALTEHPTTGALLLEDASLGHKCAAGTGSFFDHMYRRLNYESLDEFARVAYEAENPATLSGRCAVFTESDIVHLYQKGTPRDRIAAGIHQAICRNYRSAIVKGRQVRPRIGFVGGVALNPAVRKYLAQTFEVDENDILVPELGRYFNALGAALRAEATLEVATAIGKLQRKSEQRFEYPSTPPLALQRSVLLKPEFGNGKPDKVKLAALGVDIGSVSTKAAVLTRINGKYEVLAHYYRRTDGDPLAAVRDTLQQLQQQLSDKGLKPERVVCATTGSGRYLTGDYLGADLVKNEITAQAQGALCFDTRTDAIFEIGGQDSKFIQMDGEVITDFEMNRACAAGTGAFLEKQAANLGLAIEDFGDQALAGTAPPDLDWQCTVFSESAMVYYQQNNVPVADLCAGVCLASVKNYLSKNVGGRDYGKRIAFQGAVAFNKGMVAAFETATGQTIVVPPYPHLTGALGAAKLAYEQAPDGTAFRGFDAIAEGTYEISSFECKACENRCDVNVFKMDDGQKYYYNDRCERFSAVQKENRGAGLPDLFAQRQALLTACHHPGTGTGPRIGIPRTLLFNDYFPLFCTFFQELGCEVVVSEESNKRLIAAGVEATVGEPCFPIKVAHGHFADLLEKELDYLFVPGICTTEQPHETYADSKTCPYIASAPEVICTALGFPRAGVTPLAPRLYLDRGKEQVCKQFIRLAGQLGKTEGAATSAFEAAHRAQGEFSRKCLSLGTEAYESLAEGDTAFVVVGRPYAIHDQAISMNIGRKIQEMGILALPYDMLPLSEEDASDVWSPLYARQVQKKMSAARLIGKDDRLRAVVLTYFGCGPDAFANPFFKEELAEPCYVMQIDEHTADAGVVTRLEAFADTVGLAERRERILVGNRKPTPISELNGRRLWIPYVSECPQVLSSVFRAFGIDAQVLPRSTDPGLNLARGRISEDVCLPALMTTEDILARVTAPDFDPARETFMQGGSKGPCRLGMYCMLQKQVLEAAGQPDVPMVTIGGDNPFRGLGTQFAICIWDLGVAHDVLEKLLLHARPYELEAGSADALFKQYVQRLCDYAAPYRAHLASRRGKVLATLGLHQEGIKQILIEAAESFAALPKSTERRPLVSLLGEWFVRCHDGANQQIIRRLEAEGAEVLQAPMTEFFSYSNTITRQLESQRYRDTGEPELRKAAVRRKLLGFVSSRDEHALFQAVASYLPGLGEISAEKLIKLGSRWVHPAFGGEAICSLGRAEELMTRNVDGFVNVIPFGCMPGTVVTQLSEAFRRQHGGVPFLNLDYDGFHDSSRDTKIRAFMAQVAERYRAQAAAP